MNKYKKLASNTIVFAIGGFGSKILAFLLTRLYTANLESGQFNTKEVLEMCANLLIPMVSFSIADAIIRYGLDKNYERESVFSNAVTVMPPSCLSGLSPLEWCSRCTIFAAWLLWRQ